jgi:hypothetical protein
MRNEVWYGICSAAAPLSMIGEGGGESAAPGAAPPEPRTRKMRGPQIHLDEIGKKMD